MAGMPLPGRDFTEGANPSPVTSDGVGQAIIGPTAMGLAGGAAQNVQAGNYSGAAGNLAGAAVVGGLHALAAPIVVAHDAAATVAGHAANLVGGFLGGLAGHVAAPVTAAPTAPVVAPPAQGVPAVAAGGGMPVVPRSPYFPVADLPSPRAGVQAFRQANGGVGYVATDSGAAAPAGGMPVAAATPQYIPRTGVDTPDRDPNTLIDLSGGMMRNPAYRAGGMPTGQQPAQSSVEKTLDVPGGTIQRMIERAPQSQQFGMMQQAINAEATARKNQVSGAMTNEVFNAYKASQAPQQKGESVTDYKQRVADGINKILLQGMALTNSQGLMPASTTGVFEEK